MRRTKFPDRRIEGLRSKGDSFDRVSYDEVVLLHSIFEDATWTDCRFGRVLFGTSCRFLRCRFTRCRFEKQHTYLSAVFRDCVFDECEFRDVQFWGSKFEKCVFRGRMENVVFYGPEAEESWRTVLSDVDFSATRLELVDFRCGIDLSTTRMPT